MSHPERALCSGIDAQTSVVQGQIGERAIDASGDGLLRMKAPQFSVFDPDFSLADGVGVRSSVRPGRGRNRVKTEPDEKTKKPTDGAPKKTPPARKAPARGRYVDEYARPTR
jgi:hypothetical protein